MRSENIRAFCRCVSSVTMVLWQKENPAVMHRSVSSWADDKFVTVAVVGNDRRHTLLMCCFTSSIHSFILLLNQSTRNDNTIKREKKHTQKHTHITHTEVKKIKSTLKYFTSYFFKPPYNTAFTDFQTCAYLFYFIFGCLNLCSGSYPATHVILSCCKLHLLLQK